MKSVLYLIVLFSTVLDASTCEQVIKHGSHQQALPVCEEQLLSNPGNEIETWLHLVEIHHELGQEEKEAYYLAKIKSHPDFLSQVDYQYQWNRRVGQKYYFLRDYQQAQKFLQLGLSIAEQENNPIWLSKSFNDVGLTAYKLNRYTPALNYFKQSLALKLSHGDAYQVGKTLNNIALVHLGLEEMVLAIDYYEQALNQYLKYTQQVNFDERVLQHISHIYEDLTKAYTLHGDISNAKFFADKIIETFKLKTSPRSQARALINIGKLHLGLQQFSTARSYFEQAKAIHLAHGYEFNSDFYLAEATALFHLEKTEAALSVAKHGLELAKTSNNSRTVSQYYALMSEISRPTDLSLAFQYLQQHQANREQFLQEKYDQDLNTVQHEIEKQKIQHDLVNEQLSNANKTAKLQRLTNGVLIGLMGLLLLVSLLLLYLINKRKERIALLQSIKHHKQQLFLMQEQKITYNHNTPQLSPDELKHQFKITLVETLIDALAIWEKTTSTDRIELAEKSKVWTISIDNGTLRTRSLDKYLDLEKIPDNPRWRNVVKTCHFILSNEGLLVSDRSHLEQQLDAVLEQVKQLSLASNQTQNN